MRSPAARPSSLLGAALGRLNRLAAAIAFVAAAAAGSQTGPFIDAYAHDLAGRAAEARRQVDAIDARAAAVDLTVAAYVRTFRAADNPVFRREGEALAGQVARADALETALAALDAAGPLRRPAVFVRAMDPEIARATARRYTPALPLDPAGAGYAALAGLVGWTAWHALVGLGGLGMGLAAAAGRGGAGRPDGDGNGNLDPDGPADGRVSGPSRPSARRTRRDGPGR